ncbi:MAG: response regulator [Thermodesulfovibrionales bacterium]
MFKKNDKKKVIGGAHSMARNVLVVDDESLIRQIISIILKSAGYKVVEAVSGNDALSKMTGSTFGLVITDLRMPGMDGIEFIKQLRSESAYRSVPVIMLTSEFSDFKKSEAEIAGVSEWIVKPFIRQQLLQSVRKFMGNRDSFVNSELAAT